MRQSRAEKQLQEENCSAAGSRERTEVYVVPKADFPIWFAQENYFPEEGVFLYENRPGSTENHM